MHLFLAIDAEGLDLSHIDDPAQLVVQVRNNCVSERIGDLFFLQAVRFVDHVKIS